MSIGPKEAALRAQREAKVTPVTRFVTKRAFPVNVVATSVTTSTVCPTCKRPFPMTAADRQRKRRAKAKK